ncbi:MAG TPA: hypothetical protein H9803_01180 [Candidatus Ligilactobacillus excrementavium]|nr:hypothetical protein [Candidatus Ligilactobacillus excrementavium]
MSKICANCDKSLGFLDSTITTTDKQIIGEECYSKVFEGGVAAQTTWEMNHTFSDFKEIYDQGNKVNPKQINQSEKEEKQNKKPARNIVEEHENTKAREKTNQTKYFRMPKLWG